MLNPCYPWFNIACRSAVMVWCVIAILQACNNKSNNTTDPILYPEGKRFSEVYCISCHQHVLPQVLDRISWQKVLIQMKREMDDHDIPLREQDWLEIQQYYIQNAPNELPQPVDKRIITNQAKFVPLSWPADSSSHIPFITSINYDETNGLLYIGDIGGQIAVYDQQQLVWTYKLDNIPVQSQYDTSNRRLEVLGMGSLRPSEARTGQFLVLERDGNSQVLIDSLQRPVHFVKSDLDRDNQYEYLISSFGSTEGKVNSGRLSLFAQDQDRYTEQVIKESPGAVKSMVTDLNHDGLMDIIALFAQGREALYLFVNRGNLQFEELLIQEFDPVNGSNDFDLADMNQDGHPDIVMTNGDNGDSSPVFKSYHGVRILLNDGSNQFTTSYFYPLNGASKVISRDYDGDEDMDLVVLSMYPDLIRWKNEVLVYFENRGDLSFIPQYLEAEPGSRWILMDAADLDSDGDQDIIVGSNMRIQGILTPPRIQEEWKKNQKSVQVFSNMRIHNTLD